jgi:hypothetical protein
MNSFLLHTAPDLVDREVFLLGISPMEQGGCDPDFIGNLDGLDSNFQSRCGH